jgi:hypothetical protein
MTSFVFMAFVGCTAVPVCAPPWTRRVATVARVERPSREQHRRPVSRPVWRLFTRPFIKGNR